MSIAWERFLMKVALYVLLIVLVRSFYSLRRIGSLGQAVRHKPLLALTTGWALCAYMWLLLRL